MTPSPETKKALAEISEISSIEEFRMVCAINSERRRYYG